MKTLALLIGWVAGFLACICLFFYLFGMVYFVAVGGGYPGLVAYTPKWIFCLCPLILLGKTKELKQLVIRVDECLDPEIQKAKKAREETLRKEWRW